MSDNKAPAPSGVLTPNEFGNVLLDYRSEVAAPQALRSYLLAHDAALRERIETLVANSDEQRARADAAEATTNAFKQGNRALLDERAVLYVQRDKAEAEVERLLKGQEALRAQTVRIRRAICENDAQFYFAEDTEEYAKQLKARADKAEAEVERLDEDFRDAHRAITEWMEKYDALLKALREAPHHEECHLSYAWHFDKSHADLCVPPCKGCDCWKAAAIKEAGE